MAEIMKRLLILAFLLCLMTLPSSARKSIGIDPKADSVAMARMRARMDEIRKYRPTVALVLSGGGAKGAAHVGVIRYLEELDIPVDMVLGTSMGGLVGGLYSLGYTADQIDSLMSNMDWNWVLSDKLSREYITYSDLKYKEKYLLSIPFFYEKDYYKMMRADENRFDPAHRHDILHVGADNEDGAEFLKQNLLGSLPAGYISGQNVSNLISSLTIGYQDPMSFMDFPIPFVCVASDMVSGKAKVWYEGKINDVVVVTLFSGVCKVNAAIATQILIDSFNVNIIINSGVAGGIDSNLNIFDTVISTEVAYHDVEKGILTEFHPWMESVYFKTDSNLLNLSKKAVEKMTLENKVVWGRMVTGEAFISDEGREQIKNQFNMSFLDTCLTIFNLHYIIFFVKNVLINYMEQTEKNF